jgi:hypothetical protein
LKPEWWGSPLVQEEKYQEKPVKREEEIIMMMILSFNSIHLFMCLTTAKNGQLQPSTKITVQDNIKRKTNENTVRNLKGTNQKE